MTVIGVVITLWWFVGLNIGWVCLSYNGLWVHMTGGNFYHFFEATDSPLARPQWQANCLPLALCKGIVKESTNMCSCLGQLIGMRPYRYCKWSAAAKLSKHKDPYNTLLNIFWALLCDTWVLMDNSEHFLCTLSVEKLMLMMCSELYLFDIVGTMSGKHWDN